MDRAHQPEQDPTASPTTGSDDQVLTEDSIKAMSYEELVNLLDANGVEYPDFDYEQVKLAAWVVEQFSA